MGWVTWSHCRLSQYSLISTCKFNFLWIVIGCYNNASRQLRPLLVSAVLVIDRARTRAARPQFRVALVTSVGSRCTRDNWHCCCRMAPPQSGNTYSRPVSTCCSLGCSSNVTVTFLFPSLCRLPSSTSSTSSLGSVFWRYRKRSVKPVTCSGWCYSPGYVSWGIPSPSS